MNWTVTLKSGKGSFLCLASCFLLVIPSNKWATARGMIPSSSWEMAMSKPVPMVYVFPDPVCVRLKWTYIYINCKKNIKSLILNWISNAWFFSDKKCPRRSGISLFSDHPRFNRWLCLDNLFLALIFPRCQFDLWGEKPDPRN